MRVARDDSRPRPRELRASLPVLALLLLGAPSSQPSAIAWGQPAAIVEARELQPGPNSVTERQAREWLATLRFNSVRFLRRDGQGIWRGLAWHAGREVAVAMDARGRVAIGAQAAVGQGNAFISGNGADGSATPAVRPEGPTLSGRPDRPALRQDVSQN